MARRRRHPATVVAFDEAAGRGTVRVEGGGEVPFHCTAIADGTRTIEVGVRVLADVAPGPAGVIEALEVERLGAS